MIQSQFESIRSTLNVLIDSLLQRTMKVVKTFIHTYKENKNYSRTMHKYFYNYNNFSLFFNIYNIYSRMKNDQKIWSRFITNLTISFREMIAGTGVTSRDFCQPLYMSASVLEFPTSLEICFMNNGCYKFQYLKASGSFDLLVLEASR